MADCATVNIDPRNAVATVLLRIPNRLVYPLPKVPLLGRRRDYIHVRLVKQPDAPSSQFDSAPLIPPTADELVNPFHIHLYGPDYAGQVIRVKVSFKNSDLQFYQDQHGLFTGLSFGDLADAVMFCQTARSSQHEQSFFYRDTGTNIGPDHGSFDIGIIPTSTSNATDTPIIIDPKIKNDGSPGAGDPGGLRRPQRTHARLPRRARN